MSLSKVGSSGVVDLKDILVQIQFGLDGAIWS